MQSDDRKRNAACTELMEESKSRKLSKTDIPIIAKEDEKKTTSESCSSNELLKQKVTVVACF